MNTPNCVNCVNLVADRVDVTRSTGREGLVGHLLLCRFHPIGNTSKCPGTREIKAFCNFAKGCRHYEEA